MKNHWLFLSTGFALFSMFFGSGNLVFPITVGQESAGHYLLAALGILITGVLVPFLGVWGMLLHQGNLASFFHFLGKKGIFLFSLIALALMGPFGVLARCLTVAHGALLMIFPDVSLPTTSLILCTVIFLLTVNKNKIVTTLGTFLTPFLLLAIAVIAFCGLSQNNLPEYDSSQGWFALKNGFFQGYQTMDLLAAFFFSQFVIQDLNRKFATRSENKSTLQHFFKASLVGAGILSVVYCALVMLGWVYSPLLKDTPPQEMLGLIAMQSLGSMAAPWVCLAVVFACLTTAIVLTSLFAEFARIEIARNKIGIKTSLVATLVISFVVSTFDFAGIARFLGPILEMIYPALILLTIINIIARMLPISVLSKNQKG